MGVWSDRPQVYAHGGNQPTSSVSLSWSSSSQLNSIAIKPDTRLLMNFCTGKVALQDVYNNFYDDWPQRGVPATVWAYMYMYLKLSFQDGGRPPQEELVVTGLHWGHGLNQSVCLFPLRLRSWEYPHRLNKRPEAHLQSSRWHVYNTSPSQVCLYSHLYSGLRQPCPHLHHHLELWEPRTTCI